MVELKPHRREIQGGDEDSSSKPKFSSFLPYVLPLCFLSFLVCFSLFSYGYDVVLICFDFWNFGLISII